MIGIVAAHKTEQHSHLNASQGGVLTEYSRSGAFRRPYRTGALAVHVDDDAEKFTAANSYVELKEIRLNKGQPGRYRITWEARSSVNLQEIRTQFWVNGAPVGAEESENSNVYQPKMYDYDVDLAIGDLLQIYGKKVGTGNCYVHLFRIYYDWGLPGFGDGSICNLVTRLPLLDVDPLDVTNQDP